MAISFIKAHPPKYIGLSTDEKPVGKSEVVLESEFIETDTELVYVFTGDEWVIKTATFVPGKMHLWNADSMAWEAATVAQESLLEDIKGLLEDIKVLLTPA